MALSDGSCDPPLAVMKLRANSAMARMRIVMSGHHVRPPISSTDPGRYSVWTVRSQFRLGDLRGHCA
jgi:hypothetical protein